MCGKRIDDAVNVAVAFELIHSATLIHDDINDGGEKRRGRDAAHRVFGMQEALVTGDFLFVQGFRLGGFLEGEVVDCIADACTSMAESEILQAQYVHLPNTPIEIYREIIEGKTARAIEAGAKVGAYLGGGDVQAIQALGQYGLDLGLAFQIIDDILDIVGDENKLGKKPGLDLLEGKPTLPLLLAMDDPEIGTRLRELFIQEGSDHGDVIEALKLIRGTDALSRSRQEAVTMIAEAKTYLDILPDSDHKQALMDIGDFVVNRNV